MFTKSLIYVEVFFEKGFNFLNSIFLEKGLNFKMIKELNCF